MLIVSRVQETITHTVKERNVPLSSRSRCTHCGYPEYNENYHDYCPDGEDHKFPEGSPLGARMVAAASQQRMYGKYNTTRDSCMCPDYKYRSRICKHILAVIVLEGE